ncbi:unnamed protein product [Fraxinus pennsylvanica]|uniref:Uncharacterized protein n=1 Tax=Fraxinus pennsylvanica TaxID=56036 RepID=A0AAD1ZZB2_9LAMI|nr:unnamed protein product [Fraxinus pennsylvanica]
MASNIGNLSHGILFTLQVPHRQRLAESNQPKTWFTSAEIAPSRRLDFFFFFGRDLSRLRRICLDGGNTEGYERGFGGYGGGSGGGSSGGSLYSNRGGYGLILCIHGSDRLLELTGTIRKGHGQPQYLDKLQIFGAAYLGPFGHFFNILLGKIFKGKKDNQTVAKKEG